MIILDIADRSRPKLVSQLDYHPPLPGFTHTVLPIFERDLLVVSEEASDLNGDDGYERPKRIRIIDASVETDLVILSSAPDPENRTELWRAGGWIGAHNIHESEPSAGTAQLQNTVVASGFSAGVRVYDIHDPRAPREIAAFVPNTPAGQPGPRINDVFVEDRGIVHALDRAGGGLYTLEYTGPAQATLPGAFWLALILGSLLTQTTAALLYMKDRRIHERINLGIAVVSGLLIFLVAALDNPFAGDLSVGPDAFVTALEEMRRLK